MAYDKHTWTCDEPITVERLNHIEDGIAAGGDCDCGYECTETVTTLTEESVTTTVDGEGFNVGTLSYSQLINADSIKVTFDGVEYECPRTTGEGYYYYGALWNDSTQAYDWSEYPFAISPSTGNEIFTETAGTYSVKIEAVESSVTTTPCFDKARGYSCGEEMGVLTEESVTTATQGNYNVGTLSYSQLIDAETIRVTFDGVEYDCPRIVFSSSQNFYGGLNTATMMPDFSEYPFVIISNSSHGNTLTTETAGTYSVKIEEGMLVATTTQCFEKAVQSIASPLIVEADIAPYEATMQSQSYLDASAEEITEAVTTRGVVVKDPYGNLYSVLSATSTGVTIARGAYNVITQQTDLSAFCYTNNDYDSLVYPPSAIE